MSEHRGALTAEGERVLSPRRGQVYLEVDPPAPGHAATIGAGLSWARIPLPMELNHINVWLLRLDDGWMLVDTGLADDVCREAWETLVAQHLDGQPLRRIYVTHDHPDHMGLSRWLHERFDAPVWMSAVGHESTRDFLAAGTEQLGDVHHAFVTAHGLLIDRGVLRRSGGSEHGRWYGGLAPLGHVPRDGDRITTAGRVWQVIETSGHCRGHLCLYDAAGEVLISGDQVLPTISPNVSVLPSRPEANPLREYLDSLTRLERCAPDTLVLPSHGRPFRGLHRRIHVLRSHHHEQLDRLRAACRDEPRSGYELLEVMYGRALRGYHRFLGLGETVAHLHYLWHAGELARTVDDAGRIRFGGG